MSFLSSPSHRIKELYLSGNGITCFDLTRWEDLDLLNLNENQLSSWTSCADFFRSSCPSLKKVILSGNPIDSLLDGVVESLQSLSLERVGISQWDSIDALNAFPSLTEIRITKVPLLEPLSEVSSRYLLIARLVRITKLNGSDISPSERKDAEKYYLQQCHEELLRIGISDEDLVTGFHQSHPRYAALLEQYGTPQLSGGADGPRTLAGDLIRTYYNFVGL